MNEYKGTTESCVIYARYSSVGQNEQSIDGQIRICKEYAESKGFVVVKTYVDKAKSAWSDGDKRVDFQKMLTDAPSGAFGNIIVYKFDRFARNRLDSVVHKQRLKREYGIRVISATEPVSDDEGGEIYEMFLEWNDEKYSQRLSKRVRDGFDTSVANGNFTGGVIIWGYKLIKEPIPNKPNKYISKIVIDPETAEHIKYIFDEYAKGVDKKEIARVMTAKGVRYNGKVMNGKTFDKWLSNTKYYGLFTFGGRENTDIYPPIITKETFDKVQERLKLNRHFTRTNHIREKYLLMGKIFCGYCGTIMTADGSNRKYATYRYYGCNLARKRQCNKKLETKDRIENNIITHTIDHLQNPKFVEKIADYVVEFYNKRTDDNAIKSVDTRIQHTEKEIEITTNAFIKAVTLENDLLIRNCTTKIDELKILINDLKTQRTQLLFEQGVQITKADMIDFVRDKLTRHGDTRERSECVSAKPENDKEFFQLVVDTLVKAVYVYDDKIIVWFCIDGGKDPKIPTDIKDGETILLKIDGNGNVKEKPEQKLCSGANDDGRGGRI
ncbi:MAG: recombinase family protein [Christensenellaceae bacterium]|nr:recombinase family protein [Christensenellaceae bacterium]